MSEPRGFLSSGNILDVFASGRSRPAAPLGEWGVVLVPEMRPVRKPVHKGLEIKGLEIKGLEIKGLEIKGVEVVGDDRRRACLHTARPTR